MDVADAAPWGVAAVAALLAAAAVVAATRMRRAAEAERNRGDRVEQQCLDVEHDLDRLRAALEEAGGSIVVCDTDGRIVHRNERASDDVGPPGVLIDEAVGRLLATASAGSRASETLELHGPPRRNLFLSAAPLERDGTRLGALAAIEDVTERRRLEAMRTDFVANLTHELKTPVGALGLLADALADEDDPDVLRRLAGRMQVEAFRVSGIIDELLDLSRLESGASQNTEDVPVAVRDVVTEAVSRVRAVADHRDIVLDVACPVDATLVGDRRQLLSAVHNLLENAVKYSEAGSSVDVRVACDRTWTEISVRDRGIGIPARDLDRIFERFYRVDRARARVTGGTGLGLSIVRHVATNHGGTVHVDSIEGEGSTFVLRLPTGATEPHGAGRG